MVGKDRYVLLVDDHDDSRELLSQVLSFYGFVIESFASGEDALRCAATRGAPSAMITDIALGSMSGLDLARRIREAFANQRVPVLAVTGHADYRDAEGVFSRVLVKPISLDQLVLELTRVMGTAKVLDGAHLEKSRSAS